MPLILLAQAGKKVPSLNEVKDFVESRRSVLEQARSAKLKRIQHDIKRIANREREFSKELLESIVPVKVVWNEESAKKLQEFIPFRIEYVRNDEEEVAEVVAEVVEDEPKASK